MALVTEDGTGKSDAESYATVSAADAFHVARGNSTWTGADAVKEAALRNATAYLEGQYCSRWTGAKKTAEQALSWPRSAAYDRDGYLLSEAAIPSGIVFAAAALALRALAGPLAPDLARGGQERSVTVGPISVEWESGATPRTVYDEVDLLLYRLLRPRNVLVRA